MFKVLPVLVVPERVLPRARARTAHEPRSGDGREWASAAIRWTDFGRRGLPAGKPHHGSFRDKCPDKCADKRARLLPVQSCTGSKDKIAVFRSRFVSYSDAEGDDVTTEHGVRIGHDDRQESDSSESRS
jgi:hypothetical protein